MLLLLSFHMMFVSNKFLVSFSHIDFVRIVINSNIFFAFDDYVELLNFLHQKDASPSPALFVALDIVVQVRIDLVNLLSCSKVCVIFCSLS